MDTGSGLLKNNESVVRSLRFHSAAKNLTGLRCLPGLIMALIYLINLRTGYAF